MKTNEPTQTLAANPDLFHFTSSEGDGAKDIFIDFASILTFYIDSSYDDTALVVKMTNDSKATYIFADDANFERFVTEYSLFIKNRGSLEYVSRQMLNEIVGTLKEEVERTTKVAIAEAVQDIQKSFVTEVETFKVAVKKESDAIVETALSHQGNINKKNDELLLVIGEMVERSNKSSKVFETFSGRIEGLVSALDLITPQNENSMKEVELNTSTLNKETESA